MIVVFCVKEFKEKIIKKNKEKNKNKNRDDQVAILFAEFLLCYRLIFYFMTCIASWAETSFQVILLPYFIIQCKELRTDSR